MGLLSILTGGASKKYEAIQPLANQLSYEEAAHCYSYAMSYLCGYQADPLDPGSRMCNKTAYIEAVVALYVRLRGSDPWFSMNKGSFRMALTKAVLPNMAGKNEIEIGSILSEFRFHGGRDVWSPEDEERLGMYVFDLLEVGP